MFNFNLMRTILFILEMSLGILNGIYVEYMMDKIGVCGEIMLFIILILAMMVTMFPNYEEDS